MSREAKPSLTARLIVAIVVAEFQIVRHVAGRVIEKLGGPK